MSVENLNELNNLAKRVIENVYPNSDTVEITPEAMYPVVKVILDGLTREYMPPEFGRQANSQLICTIHIESDVLRKACRIVEENHNSKDDNDRTSRGTRNFDQFSRLEDEFVDRLLGQVIYYIFGEPLHVIAPAGICTNSGRTLFTLTTEFTAEQLTQAMERFIVDNCAAIAEAAECDYKSRLMSSVGNTNAYVKSMNDKLNEVSAIVNDFRREIVGLTESVSRGVNKLLDLVTPLTVSKKSSVKKGKTK